MEGVILLSASEIETALLPFRAGRRLVLDQLLGSLMKVDGVTKQFLLLSRLFGRIKSADSVLEKVKRKGIDLNSPEELVIKVPDILGFRLIAETPEELDCLDRTIGDQFEVLSRSDKRATPNEFGCRGIDYSLRHHVRNLTYPFELQARTFLQHYWAGRSFHLFHKKPKEVALQHLGDLLALSETLQRAEALGAKLAEERSLETIDQTSIWDAEPLRSRVHLIVVEPGERFSAHIVQNLTGNDQKDHDAVVACKLALYAANPGAAIVECCCLNFSSFALNEPHVYIPTDRLNRIVL